MNTSDISYREKIEKDNKWVLSVVTEQWGSPQIVSNNHLFEAIKLKGFIAFQKTEPVGLILFSLDHRECEIVALYSSVVQQGVGTKLMNLVKEFAIKNNCKRVWLQTTNDNTQALRFYQKRGYTIAAIRINAIKAQREIKPIPLTGNDGIPIRDEIELELVL